MEFLDYMIGAAGVALTIYYAYILMNGDEEK